MELIVSIPDISKQFFAYLDHVDLANFRKTCMLFYNDKTIIKILDDCFKFLNRRINVFDLTFGMFNSDEPTDHIIDLLIIKYKRKTGFDILKEIKANELLYINDCFYKYTGKYEQIYDDYYDLTKYPLSYMRFDFDVKLFRHNLEKILENPHFIDPNKKYINIFVNLDLGCKIRYKIYTRISYGDIVATSLSLTTFKSIF